MAWRVRVRHDQLSSAFQLEAKSWKIIEISLLQKTVMNFLRIFKQNAEIQNWGN